MSQDLEKRIQALELSVKALGQTAASMSGVKKGLNIPINIGKSSGHLVGAVLVYLIQDGLIDRNTMIIWLEKNRDLMRKPEEPERGEVFNIALRMLRDLDKVPSRKTPDIE